MIGFVRTRVRKQLIIAFCFEFENELKFYNLEARSEKEHFSQTLSFLNDVISYMHVICRSYMGRDMGFWYLSLQRAAHFQARLLLVYLMN